VMLIDDKHVAGGTSPAWVALGDGDALRGSHLELSVVMTDIQAATNKLGVTLEVEGPGATRVSISNTGNDGDSAAYSIIIFFA
jgi:hypothetical protein